MIEIGKRYRHFKGFQVKVIAVAMHTETKEELVIYEEENSGQVWARPKAMFLSKVDKNKYPTSTQDDRFVKIDD